MAYDADVDVEDLPVLVVAAHLAGGNEMSRLRHVSRRVVEQRAVPRGLVLLRAPSTDVARLPAELPDQRRAADSARPLPALTSPSRSISALTPLPYSSVPLLQLGDW